MTNRETVAWGDLTDDLYIILNFGTGEEVHHVAKALTIGNRTSVIFAETGNAEQHNALDPIELATDDEVTEYLRTIDRLSVARALSRLGSRIVDERLPVPAGGRGVFLSFDLPDDADLLPWAESLSQRPQPGTSRPVIKAEAEGLEVYVYGPGTSGEFGPDLADVALTQATEGDDTRELLVERLTAARDELGRTGDVKLFGVIKAHETNLRHMDARAGVQRRYDPMPTIDSRDPQAYAKYAARLDNEQPGWWRDDVRWMAPELADEALNRRAEDCSMPEALKPERDGFAPPSGHAAVLPPDALKHDGRYDDNRGTEA